MRQAKNISAAQRNREARGEINYRPQPWAPKRVFTVYMDYTTGQGVQDNGTAFKTYIGGRTKNPTLTDKLNSAAYAAGTLPEVRIMLTGKVPPNDRNTRHWLLVQTPGWSPDRGHWLGTPPTGRFTQELTGKRVEVRVAYEWFGDASLTPNQARLSWTYLSEAISKVWASSLESSESSTPLLLSPAATGTNLWAASLPKSLNPVPVSHDIAEELHATSGQHHQDHLVTGPSFDRHPDVLPMIDTRVVSKVPSFSYVDGRFMFASLCWELGTGPGIRLARGEAFDLWQADKYFRGRMRVRFHVPDTWEHVGILGVQHKDVSTGWFYPNRPGAVHTTWADASEVYLAEKQGWGIEPIEAIAFDTKMDSVRKRFHGEETTARRHETKAKVLDEWSRKLVALREGTAADPYIDATIKRAVGAALRAILIQGIGAFASRGRSSTVITYDPTEIPSDVHVERKGQAYSYQRPQPMDSHRRLFYHPEYTTQIWGRGRAKVMSSKASGTPTGALHLDPRSVIGINGDAVYTTSQPRWALPTELGGADNGTSGRLRLQGYLEGPLTPPGSRAERDKLRERAVRAGTDVGGWYGDTVMDQAAFPLEFDTVDDRISSYDSSDLEEGP